MSRISIHPCANDTPHRAFCGPTAISAITGQPISRVYKAIRLVRSRDERKYIGRRLANRKVFGGRVYDTAGRRIPIRGISNRELLATMCLLGCEVAERCPVPYPTTNLCPTLRAFCNDRLYTGPYVVNVTDHYIAFGHGQIVCSRLAGGMCAWCDYPHLRTRVQTWWRFA